MSGNFFAVVAVAWIVALAARANSQGFLNRIFPFPLPGLGGGLPGNGSGLPGNGTLPGGGLEEILNCRPLNRTLVVNGIICFEPNQTAINCQNHTCNCQRLNLPQPPILPSPFPNLPVDPIPLLPLSVWNCTSSSVLPGTSTSSTPTIQSTEQSSSTIPRANG